MLIVSGTVNNCAMTGLELEVNLFVTELQKRFKIENRVLLKEHLRFDYEWGIQSDIKALFKATRHKNITSSIRTFEDYLSREANFCEQLGKLHECLSKNEGQKPISMNIGLSLVN